VHPRRIKVQRRALHSGTRGTAGDGAAVFRAIEGAGARNWLCGAFSDRLAGEHARAAAVRGSAAELAAPGRVQSAHSGLLDVPLPRDEGGLRPILLDLKPEAKAAWIDFHNEVERELAPGGELADARDVASKAADNAARMAGLFPLYEKGPAGSMGETHIRAAASIVTWHLLEARRLLGELVLPRAISNAAKLDAWLRDYCRRRRTASIPHRKVRQYGPGPLRDKAALAETLVELEEAARARVDQDGRQKWIRMNPRLAWLVAIPERLRELSSGLTTAPGLISIFILRD
jgi:Protein of unknown function (DUF3987)